MPFDGTQVNIYALRRAQLIDALRREMPENFEWDFYQFLGTTKCGYAGCAIGLIAMQDKSFTIYGDPKATFQNAAVYLGISLEVSRLCFNPDNWSRTPTPQDVAARLERLTKDLPAI